MLTKRYASEEIRDLLLDTKEWKYFPKASEREAWEKWASVPVNVWRKQWIIEKAEGLLGKDWPFIPATAYMAFVRTGNRVVCEEPSFARRQNLAFLAMAECLEKKGRFIDEIINGIWAICEETTWTVSAHSARDESSGERDVLPYFERDRPALFSCETAASLGVVSYLLADELDEVSPVIRRRIKSEIIRRIIEPVENPVEHLFWMEGGNNWAPWCCASSLEAAMCVLDDGESDRLSAFAYLLMGVVSKFIDKYHDDGGCDEGPSYWGVAGGAMLDFLEMLYAMSGGKITVYDEPKIRAMGEYFYKVSLNNCWCANFADARGRNEIWRKGVTYRYGERVGCRGLCDMTLLAMRGWDETVEVDGEFTLMNLSGGIMMLLREMFWVPVDEKPGRLIHPLSDWFPDLQVMVARTSEDSAKGFVVAAKAGHNAENHNHNDVGQFILVFDGRPVVVDVGVGVYTRDTFTAEGRYKNWTIRGSGHNVPVINGFEQIAGREHEAKAVSFEDENGGRIFSLDMAAAYPQEAGVESLVRNVTVPADESQGVTVADSVRLKATGGSVTLNMYSPGAVDVISESEALFDCGGRKVRLAVSAPSAKIEAQTVDLNDKKLEGSWGKTLAHVTLSYAFDGEQADMVMKFKPE